MRINVEPTRVELVEGTPFTVAITVTNTSPVIGGYHLRILGADPSWVTLEAENLSLFPDTSQTVTATVLIPKGVNSGDRRIAVQVRELTPPQSIAVAEIDLLVPAREALRLALTPMTVIAGKTAKFGVIAENIGNTPLTAMPIGIDPEDKIHFEFIPAYLDLAPGEHVIADMRATARRRWFGTPVVRPFGIATAPPEPAAPPGPVAPGEEEPVPEPPEPLAQGTMLQKPRLSRGALSLISLLLAVSVFAVVITIALSRLVGVSAADRDLAIQVASAQTSGVGTGTSTIGGAVSLLTNGAPAVGVAVELFAAGDLTNAIISTATNDKGLWAVKSLGAGSYKVRFRGAGFAQVWYPNALDGSSAQAVQLQAGQSVTNLAVALGGLPATVSGQVIGDDPAGAVLTVQVPVSNLQPVTKVNPPTVNGGTVTAAPAGPTTGVGDAAAVTTAVPGLRPQAPATRPLDANAANAGAAVQTTAPGPTGAAVPPAGTPGGTAAEPGAVLKTIPIAADGMFSISDLPSPAVYDLVVSKVGYATDTQRIDLAGGESRSGIQLHLRTGDGLISGTIVGPDGPLGGAIVTGLTGTTSVKTQSLTSGSVGAFTLRGLVTPATYTVTVTLAGYGTVTSTLNLSAGQKLTGVQLTLANASGSLAGMVTSLPGGAPAPGVTVAVTGGDTKVSTVTQSTGNVGAWTVAGLPIPGTYTITFSRSDLQSQTVAVAVDSAGRVTGGATTSTGVNVSMTSAFAVVTGIVTQESTPGKPAQKVGEAIISLTSGSASYTVTSASVPDSNLGLYEVTRVEPGTYTLSAQRAGTTPTTVIITVVAGQVLTYNPVMIPPASLSGQVFDRSGGSTNGLQVNLYLSSAYPAQVYKTTSTDVGGHYSFPQVDAPQAYVVEVRSTLTGPLGSQTVVLGASQAGILNITVGTTATSAAAAPSTTTAAAPPATSPPAAPTVPQAPPAVPAAAPIVTTQPNDLTDPTIPASFFTAAATGTPTPTVQWQVSINGGTTFTDIPGATSTTYSFTVDPADSGNQYRAVFTNSLGVATSNSATLTVNP